MIDGMGNIWLPWLHTYFQEQGALRHWLRQYDNGTVCALLRTYCAKKAGQKM